MDTSRWHCTARARHGQSRSPASPAPRVPSPWGALRHARPAPALRLAVAGRGARPLCTAGGCRAAPLPPQGRVRCCCCCCCRT
eukprot:scaffold1938_cov399-Prasinococcus_capsulatus_cf.AAC.22